MAAAVRRLRAELSTNIAKATVAFLALIAVTLADATRWQLAGWQTCSGVELIPDHTRAARFVSASALLVRITFAACSRWRTAIIRIGTRNAHVRSARIIADAVLEAGICRQRYGAKRSGLREILSERKCDPLVIDRRADVTYWTARSIAWLA